MTTSVPQVDVLELPRRPGEPQQEPGLAQEASYIISVKNPEVPSPQDVGLSPSQQAELPTPARGAIPRRLEAR